MNPKSGSGKSKNLFKDIVEPMLKEADVPFEVLITERSNHAYDVVKNMDVSSIYGIVIISGDGLVYEVCINQSFIQTREKL